MMSSATQRQAKAARDKPNKTNTESSKTPDGPSKLVQATAEQIRLAQMISDSKDMDEPDLQGKIKQIIELTGKSSDEAAVALHDCDNDTHKAIEMLLDGDADQGQWNTLVKKKKSRQVGGGPAARSPDVSTGDSPATVNNKENRTRSERGKDREGNRDFNSPRGPPRLSRGRGRESEKNERNLEDSRTFDQERQSDRRGRGRMMNGPFRFGGRGRGGGGSGPGGPRSRTFQNRGSRSGGGGGGGGAGGGGGGVGGNSGNGSNNIGGGGGSTFQGIETWASEDPAEPNATETSLNVGSWDSFPVTEDWDNEDWTGNLSETKVFTPSTANAVAATTSESDLPTEEDESLDVAPEVETTVEVTNSIPVTLAEPEDNSAAAFMESYKKLEAASLENNKCSVGNKNLQPSLFQSLPPFDAGDIGSSTFHPATVVASSNSYGSLPGVPGSCQPVVSSNQLPSAGSLLTGGTASVQVSNSLPQRPKTQRTRTPAPAKIPSLAVEMPDDALEALNVPFGGLAFGSEPSTMEFAAVSGNSSIIPPSGCASLASNNLNSIPPRQSVVTMGNNVMPVNMSSASMTKSLKHGGDMSSVYQQSGPSTVNVNAVDMSHSQGIGQSLLNQQSMAQVRNDHMSATEPMYSTQSSERKSTTPFSSQRNMQATALEGLLSRSIGASKQDQSPLNSYGVPAGMVSGHGHSPYQQPYVNQKPAAYQPHSQSLSAGSNVQFNQPNIATATASVAYPSNGSSGVTVQGVQGSASVMPSAVPVVTGYGSSSQGQVMANVATVSFPSAVQQASVSNAPVYGMSQGQSQGTVSATSSPYINQQNQYVSASATTYAHAPSQSTYGTTNLHSVAKHQSSLKENVMDASGSQHGYESVHTTSTTGLSATLTTATSSVSSGLGLVGSSASTNTAINSSKSLMTSGSRGRDVQRAVDSIDDMSVGKTGMPASLQPGVPAVLGHQYIMGQAGLPFYGLQQQMYSYEDLQMLQQRVPLAGYYDISFQPQTTLTGRDTGLANVAYSGADTKFSRGDSNSSPVPTTLSQQQSTSQQHQQTFLSPTALAHSYSYYYPGGMLASGFPPQYGTPIYPVPPATNAHGATSNTQFQKQATYGSHAYSGYDTLGQSQDYSKSGYGSNSQSQNKGLAGSSSSGAVNSSNSTDLSASVYNKAHVQLGKQSFDKPGFHAGTPPPFNMAGSQGGPMGAPNQAYTSTATPFIPLMTHHQQHHSPMMHHQHQMHQDSQAAASQRGGPGGPHNKPNAGNKQSYGNNYWPSN